MKIALINHSLTALEALRQVISQNTRHAVVWTAAGESEALDMLKSVKPDLAILDVYMPEMGIADMTTFFHRLNVAVLISFHKDHANSADIFNAMGAGALDSAQLPEFNSGGAIREEADILEKIKTMEQYLGMDDGASEPLGGHAAAGKSTVLAIGSSTGGPAAIREILSGIPLELNLSVVVIQHMDENFSSNLAIWLDKSVAMPVSSAMDGDYLSPGRALVARTNDHLVCTRTGQLKYQAEPKDYPYRPSVDVFFESLVKSGITPGIALILTGMGKDGAKGLLALKRAGWYTIGQDKKTSTVYGMPKAAYELGACRLVLPVDRMARAITAKAEKHFIRN